MESRILLLPVFVKRRSGLGYGCGVRVRVRVRVRGEDFGSVGDNTYVLSMYCAQKAEESAHKTYLSRSVP